jgi:myo-inositol-1(or 4)-monophosphatase
MNPSRKGKAAETKSAAGRAATPGATARTGAARGGTPRVANGSGPPEGAKPVSLRTKGGEAAKPGKQKAGAVSPKPAPAPAPTRIAKPAAKPAPKAATRPVSKGAVPAKASPARSPMSNPSKPKPAAAPERAPAAEATQPTPAPTPAPASAGAAAKPAVKKANKEPLSREFLFELAKAIKDAVEPVARAGRGAEIVGNAVSGDATFELDRVAEKALLQFLKSARAPVAYYSEEAGYSTFSNVQAKHLLVVDPVDGTRAAKNGFEGCVVSIASTPVIERPTMADVESGCVMEILGNRTFYAERGKGARVYENGQAKRPRLSQNTNLERLAWTMTVPARPAELIFPTAGKLIDLTSLKGGFFACNSTSFSLTRLLTHQLDACVDFAGRYMKDIPHAVRDMFINAGRGVVLGICPYDMAAALLIVQEAGCVATNAYGGNFDDVLLLDSTEANQQSMIAAANPEMHAKLLHYFDTRIRQFEALLQKKHK